MPSPINLDRCATTPIRPEVVEAMNRCHVEGFANPASQHSAGRRARQRLDEAREQIASLLGARLAGRRPDRVVFTSGGTEANNLVLRGLAGSTGGRLAVSSVEHPSVAGTAEALSRAGYDVQRLPVDSNGLLQFDAFEAFLRTTPSPRLVSILWGNNETGVLQPIERLAALANEAGVPMHSDAVQVAGKLPIDFAATGLAAMSVTAHKFHGPLGVGALVLRGDVQLEPSLFGGFQQEGLRPGTESVVLAVGMARALELWHAEQSQRLAHLMALRDRLEANLRAGWPDLVIVGREAPRLPHVTNVAFTGLDRQRLAIALDLAGIACSTGSACASGSSEPSPVLLAMGCREEVVAASIRLSVGTGTTLAEVEDASKRILNVCNHLKSASGRRKSDDSSPQIHLKPL